MPDTSGALTFLEPTCVVLLAGILVPQSGLSPAHDSSSPFLVWSFFASIISVFAGYKSPLPTLFFLQFFPIFLQGEPTPHSGDLFALVISQIGYAW